MFHQHCSSMWRPLFYSRRHRYSTQPTHNRSIGTIQPQSHDQEVHYKNKAITDIKLCCPSGAVPQVSHFQLTPYLHYQLHRAHYWKYDIIHGTETTYCIATPLHKDRAKAIGKMHNTWQSLDMWFWRYAHRQINRRIDPQTDWSQYSAPLPGAE